MGMELILKKKFEQVRDMISEAVNQGRKSGARRIISGKLDELKEGDVVIYPINKTEEVEFIFHANINEGEILLLESRENNERFALFLK